MFYVVLVLQVDVFYIILVVVVDATTTIVVVLDKLLHPFYILFIYYSSKC